MFSVIQQQINAFGGLNVIVVGDLAHQYNFNGFFHFVKWCNAKIVTAGLPALLYKKENNFNYHKPLNTILNIIGYNQTTNQITLFVIYMLPVNENKFLILKNNTLVFYKSINIPLSFNSFSPISSAIDFIDNQQYNSDDAQKLFKRKLTF
ncbi:hypothetical protein RhiirA5_410710 [Rhizophagus irregularis]|uniref:Uncharacterized protein n=1 Tax=Rhizophagus irregularis TaxID=588596 RepID=A0A2N0Q2P6_9GLOM|nr:hypothetical protein RhiirA5_410710 [Rhizophagus irregularis]